MRDIAFRFYLLVLCLLSLLFVFFFKTVIFLKLTLLDECRGDHGDELVR